MIKREEVEKVIKGLDIPAKDKTLRNLFTQVTDLKKTVEMLSLELAHRKDELKK